jgi:hypothetical protein
MPTHDHGGTAIDIIYLNNGAIAVDDNGHLYHAGPAYDRVVAELRAALGSPDPARLVPGDGELPDSGADRSQLDILRDELLDACAIELRRSGDTTAISKRSADRWLIARDG